MLILPVTSKLRSGTDNSQTLAVFKAIESAELSAMIVLNETLSTAADRMGSTGAYVASGVLILVPRSIWPGKTTGTGIESAELLGHLFTNVGVSAVFDLYLNFGWLGIGVCAAIFGVILSRSYRSGGECSIFAAMFFMVIPIMLRGDLSTAMISVYALTVAAVMSHFMLRLAWK